VDRVYANVKGAVSFQDGERSVRILRDNLPDIGIPSLSLSLSYDCHFLSAMESLARKGEKND
jgi:hypothetical protein